MGTAARGAAAVALAAAVTDVLADVMVHVLGDVVVVMDAELDVPVHAKGVATDVIMGAWVTVMVVVKEGVIVNAMAVLEHVLLDAEEDVQAVRAVRAVAVVVHKDAAGDVVVIARDVPVVVAAVRAVRAVPAVRAAQAAAVAVAVTAIRAARMHVLLSARRQPVGAAEAHVLPAALEVVETLVHQTARAAARIAARPPAHRPAIPPARTSASAVRNNNR